MTIDYKKLGFKSGIEIHQQLTGKKLFCSCPTEIRKGNTDFEIVRNLRLSTSEIGKMDKAAKYEKDKDKSFKYLGYEDINCLVEIDEEPPHKPNSEAIIAATKVAKLLNCQLMDRIEFMRKVVIDGSNVSGFQRTAIIGLNGKITINGKEFGVETVCLEEEACQSVGRTEKQDTYNLSRLGIPLIEIATAPDMNTPEEVKAVAEHIGMILRSTDMVRRGIGSIRQDVNISIKGSNRVEIKGFQELKSIPKVIEYEVIRQSKLSKKEDSHVRKAETDFTTTYLRPMPGSARMYPETDIRPFMLPTNIELPELLSDKLTQMTKKYNLAEHMVKELIKQKIDFDKYAKTYDKLKPLTIAEFFVVLPKEIKKKIGKEFVPLKNVMVLEKLNSGKISSSSLEEITQLLANGKKVDYTKYQVADNKDVEKVVRNIYENNKNAPINALMGMAMKELKGKADGKKVMEILQKIK